MARQMGSALRFDLDVFREMVVASIRLSDEDLDRLGAFRDAMMKDKSTR